MKVSFIISDRIIRNGALEGELSMVELHYSEEVWTAIREKQPLVGLETAVVTHGLPYPTNIELAQAMEKIIREQGAVPATVGVLGGKTQIGMNKEDLQLLAQDREVIKVSRRDFSRAAAKKLNGGTTVAGTLTALNKAGINVFATGGIGGVHRNAPYDISADLLTLAQTPALVVCAGAKSILDLPATLEMLETLSVPVVGFQTSLFPAFYARSSGLPVNSQVEDSEGAAILAKAHWGMGINSAVLLVVPPPLDDALPDRQMQEAVDQALSEVKNLQIQGQEVTPFLLKRISEITGKASLKANLGLLLNNARVAARVAVKLVKS
jgi:pseudouridine-5'-phosphate glycosidase